MTDQVTRLFTGAPWENVVGYCRAIKVNNQIFVSGTATSACKEGSDLAGKI